MVKLGPVLKFLGCGDINWHNSIMVVVDANDSPPSLILSDKAIAAPAKLADLIHTKATVWRWESKIPLKEMAQSINYKVNGRSYTLQIPAKNKMPAIAYAYCNGFSDPKLMKQVTIKNALWSREPLA